MERLWERSREGRKETNRKLSTGTGKESMRDQAGENGEKPKKRERKRSAEEATVRQKREEKGKEETEAE